MSWPMLILQTRFTEDFFCGTKRLIPIRNMTIGRSPHHLGYLDLWIFNHNLDKRCYCNTLPLPPRIILLIATDGLLMSLTPSSPTGASKLVQAGAKQVIT